MPLSESARVEISEDIGKKPVVFFEVDNTLIDGFSIFLFAKFLNRRNLFLTSKLRAMNIDMANYRRHHDYKRFAEKVVANYANGLKGLPKYPVEKAGRGFVEKYSKSLFPYSRDLTQLMSQHGYPIAVSGAPKEAFEPLAQQLGIQKTYLLEA